MSELKEKLKQIMALVEPYIIESRRHLHSIPELGLLEEKTSAFIQGELIKLGYTPICGIAKTGIIADLKFANPGPCVMIRADMDALLVTECTGLPFASTHPGRMHACGHDGHMAMVLGVARVMAEISASEQGKELCGSIRFLFQPAEEGLGGALSMIEAGALEGVDCCLATHIWPILPEGSVGVRGGPLMAAMDRFKITLKGRGGHSSQPHLCTNVLGAAAGIALTLQREVAAWINPVLPAVLSVCHLEVGDTFNVIPQTAEISGCTRSFHKEVCQVWESKINQIVGGLAGAYGLEYEFDYMPGHAPVNNDARITGLVRDAVAEILGEDKIVEPELSLAGEDFSCFQDVVPGCMFFLGAGSDGLKTLHSPQFSFNEDILALGSLVFCRTAFNILSAGR